MSHISYPHPQRETVNSSSIEVIRSLSVLAMAVAFDSWRWAYVTRAAGCQMLPDFFSGWWFEALWKMMEFVKWDYCSQYDGKVIKVMFQSPPTSFWRWQNKPSAQPPSCDSPEMIVILGWRCAARGPAESCHVVIIPKWLVMKLGIPLAMGWCLHDFIFVCNVNSGFC